MVEPSPTGSKESQTGVDFNHGERGQEVASALGLFPGATLCFFSGTSSIDDGTLTKQAKHGLPAVGRRDRLATYSFC
jgi:hypothetical protein